MTCPPGSIFDAKYGNATMYVCEYNPPGNVYPADNFREYPLLLSCGGMQKGIENVDRKHRDSCGSTGKNVTP